MPSIQQQKHSSATDGGGDELSVQNAEKQPPGVSFQNTERAQPNEFEACTLSIFKELLQDKDFSEVIAGVLNQLLSITGVDQAFLAETDFSCSRSRRTHLQCNPNNKVNNIPISLFDWQESGGWAEKLMAGQSVWLTELSENQCLTRVEYELFSSVGIRSVGAVPLIVGETSIGILGLANSQCVKQWSNGEKRLLSMIADLVSIGLQREHQRAAVVLDGLRLDSLMHGTDHFIFFNFSLDQYSNSHIQLESVSDSLKSIVNQNDIKCFENWFDLAHPEDLPRLQQAYLNAIDTGTNLNESARMLDPNSGQWTTARVVFHPIRDDAGRITHYNGYWVDISRSVKAASKLQAERDFASAVMATVGSLVVVFDALGNIVQFNNASEQLTGFAFDEVQGKPIWDTLLVSEERQAVKDIVHDLGVATTTSTYENSWITKDGERRLIAWKYTAILDEAGELKYAIGSGTDVTDIRKSHKLVKTLTSAVEHSPIAVIMVNNDGMIDYANPAYLQLVDCKIENCRGNPTEILGSRSSAVAEQQDIWKCIDSGRTWRADMEISFANNENHWLSTTIYQIDNALPGHGRCILLLEDMTKLKTAYAQMRELAYYDSLTELPNRRMFKDRLGSAVAQLNNTDKTISLLYLDLDDFKRVNDSFGHEIGDQLLVEVANRLRNCVEHSCEVFRLGGDEFVILFDNTMGGNTIHDLAQRVLSVIKKPIKAGQFAVEISCSIGITVAPNDGCDAAELMKNADLAMYRSKNNGGDWFSFFEEQMNIVATKKVKMESELRVALDNNQIKPYFQPIVRLDTLEVVGFEALARWIHPERGMIPPIEFIPVAEDTGLIGRLSSCLLETSMKELAKLRKVKQADFYVSVNVSARQTRDWTLLQDIERLLEETGLDGAALNLEITESLLLEEFSAAQTLMETARERWGTRVAIDDFGTGYSSLSYLKKLPFDSLKIDRSFVKELPDDSDDAVITQAIVAMAHALGKELIAEGIENSEQLAYLKSLGCEFGQGYLFGKPAEISTFFDQGGPVELDKAS